MQNDSQLACHECDLIVKLPVLAAGQKAICPRCGFTFTRYFLHARSKLFSFTVTALIFLALTLIFPFLTFSSQGSQKTVYFIESLRSLGSDSYLGLVLFMQLTTLVIPVLSLLGIAYVLISSKLKRTLPFTLGILRLVFLIQPWNMAEIFLLGILVSMVKIASLAYVQFGWSFYSFVLFIISMAATRLYFDRYQIWKWVSQHQQKAKI